jgi:L-cysteine:1D-myo-inositol 2-amino-2-deoxy-alpha-D-glucopyranoside ligase
MQSWPHPDVPLLPGTGVPLRLYDSATMQVRPTAPGPTARMYVCGITPYDATHLGHAATYLTFDLVNRVWRDGGHDVAYVQNVTDVDDPLFERANRDGEDWIVLGMRETALFREDMTALRVLPPAHYVGVVEAVEEIAELVEKLVSIGVGYQLEDGTGDVYQDIRGAGRFGYESGYDAETMARFFAERGGDPDRPGNRLGMGIDVQGGGSDLIFPHHEMSALHAEAAADQWPFARHYVHAGMIGLDGEKMSKSRGNLVFVSRLRGDRVDPMAIRLALLSGHYRTDRSWTRSVLDEAQARLARWRDATALATGPSAIEMLARVRERLADDLDTPAALHAVDRWADAALASGPGQRLDPSAPALVRSTVDALLGIAL